MATRYEWHEGGMNMSLEGDWIAHADYSAERANAQAEIARLRGALEACQRYALEFPDSLLRDNLLDTAADALK